MQVIEAQDVVKEFTGVRALAGVSFEAHAGEVFALVGPNGAGKTTLLRLLTNILKPDSGRLSLFGSEDIAAGLSRIGYMPEERGLYKNLCALETVTYFAELKGMRRADARRAAAEAIEAVGMAGHAKRKLEELSKGMSQRIQFAATIVHKPDLVLMDEPFSGLDPVSGLHLQELVERMRSEGRTVLLSTHNMEHAERLCDRLLMLHRGTVRLYGSLAEIKQRYVDGSVRVTHRGMLPELHGAEAVAEREGSTIITLPAGMSSGAAVARLVELGADLVGFEPVEPSLEEIFVKVAGAEGEADLVATRANAA